MSLQVCLYINGPYIVYIMHVLTYSIYTLILYVYQPYIYIYIFLSRFDISRVSQMHKRETHWANGQWLTGLSVEDFSRIYLNKLHPTIALKKF